MLESSGPSQSHTVSPAIPESFSDCSGLNCQACSKPNVCGGLIPVPVHSVNLLSRVVRIAVSPLSLMVGTISKSYSENIK